MATAWRKAQRSRDLTTTKAKRATVGRKKRKTSRRGNLAPERTSSSASLRRNPLSATHGPTKSGRRRANCIACNRPTGLTDIHTRPMAKLLSLLASLLRLHRLALLSLYDEAHKRDGGRIESAVSSGRVKVGIEGAVE